MDPSRFRRPVRLPTALVPRDVAGVSWRPSGGSGHEVTRLTPPLRGGEVVDRVGLEPTASGSVEAHSRVQGGRSYQLNYRPTLRPIKMSVLIIFWEDEVEPFLFCDSLY